MNKSICFKHVVISLHALKVFISYINRSMRQIAAYELIEKNMTENSFEIIADCGGCVPLSNGHRMFLVQNPLHAAVWTGAIQFQRSREALLSYRQTDFLGNTSR
jgi:hypothetical protein